MTFESYVRLHNMCTVTEQLILVTLFCEILVILWNDKNSEIGVFLGEMLLCGAFIMTNVMSVMGLVMTGLTYVMIVSFVIKLTIMVSRLPATVRHRRLVNRCKRVCKQNQWPTMADDICRICQTYCRQVRQKNLHP